MPQNAFYYHTAYVVAGMIYGLYAVGLLVRRRGVEERRRRSEEAGSREQGAGNRR